jgi:2-amino-4-hydroxy-6-hydroxymethyldihydropteridine diphosphokinase
VSRAVLSLGSNLGDREALLRAAVRGLGAALRGVSPVFETPPWGPVPQGDYLNAVAIVDDPGVDAAGWLVRAAALEAAAGRVRELRWGPRTLDVDVIAVWDGAVAVCCEDPALTLPHPRAARRAFVLVPWLALDSRALLPGAGKVRELLAALPAVERAGVRPRPDIRLSADDRARS